MLVHAKPEDKELIVNMLTKAFSQNKSVDYIISSYGNREKRIKSLMEYSFDVCKLFGKVYVSEDKNACALVFYSDQKKNTLKSIFFDLKLIINCTGPGNISKVMAREKAIKSHYPDVAMSYLWFIGVAPEFQNQGLGKILLEEITEESRTLNRPLYLETSSEKNVSWYLKSGFELYQQLDFGYKLFMFRKVFK